MHRRTLLTSLAAACLLPNLGAAYTAVPYAPTTWPDLRDSSDKIVLNWRANWSITCQIKEELLAKLLMEEPKYRAITFVDVDWDTFGPSVWAERLKVERRSTLIALRGKTEIARIVNEPYERQLRRFLEDALAA